MRVKHVVIWSAIALVTVAVIPDLRWGVYHGYRQFLTLEGRIARLESRARHAAELGHDVKAEALYRELWGKLSETEKSERAYAAYQHAIVLGRLGRSDEAVAQLTWAVDAGETELGLFLGDPKLAALAADPRVKALARKAEEAAQKQQREYREAERAVDPKTTPQYESWKALSAAFEKEKAADKGHHGFAEAVRVAKRRIATVERYVDEHPGASDREEAWIDELRRRVREDFAWSETTYADNGAALRERSNAFVTAYPQSRARSEATLYAVIGTARGVMPEDHDWRRDLPPHARWRDVLGELEPLANGDPSKDVWTAAALGYLALARFDAGQLDVARATAKKYLSVPEPDWDKRTPFHSRLQTENRVVTWKIDGLPAVAAKRLDGTTVDLSKIKGKFTLIDFWSPG